MVSGGHSSDAGSAPTDPRVGRRERPAGHAPASLDGASFGAYRLERVLGRGGMGVVYAARDPRLDRRVAIKVLSRDTWSEHEESGRQRLTREAIALAKLSHPHIVTVHEIGEHDGEPFVVMEYVEGGTLRDWLRERKRSPKEIVRVFRDAGRGLAAAHGAGLVHRDLKPENLLVDRAGRARVSDFGLVTSAAPGDSAAQLTVDGAGTPDYMAPEQAAGRHVDARSDQYAYCVTLHEALTGARPRGGAVAPALPRWLRAILSRGLERDPARRYPSMDALLVDLAHDPAARRRLWLAIAGAAALAGGAAALGMWSQREGRLCQVDDPGVWSVAGARAVERAFADSGAPYARAAAATVDRSLRDYLAGWRAQRVDACLETRVRGGQSEEVLDRRVACLDERLAAARDLVAVLTHADRAAVDGSAAALARLPELLRCADRAHVLARVAPPGEAVAAEVARLRGVQRVAAARFRAGQYAAAQAELGPILDDVARVGYAPLEADVFHTLGMIENWSGQAPAAAGHLERAYFAARRSGHDETAALAAIELVDVFGWELLRFDDAARWAAHARAEVERSARGTRAQADLHISLGLYSERRARVDEALAHYRAALQVLVQLGEGRGALAARVHTHLGAVLDLGGRYREAIAAYGASLETRAALSALSHPDNVNTLALLAFDHAQTGSAGALGYATAAVTIGESTLGTHPKTGLAHVALAAALDGLGAGEAARGELARAQAIFEATRPAEHPNLGLVHTAQANVLLGLGRAGEALVHAERGLAVHRAAFGERHPATAKSLTTVAAARLAAGRAAEAQRAAAAALAVLDEVNPDGDGTPDALRVAAQTLRAVGRDEEAARARERALRVAAAQGLSLSWRARLETP